MASREARASNVRSSVRGRRVMTSHSAGPVRLRSIRVCTRRVTISMATGPFSPSRTVYRLQVTHGGIAGHTEHISFITLTQRLAKPRVAAQLIITGDPAVWHLRTPCIEHLQTLLLARLVT